MFRSIMSFSKSDLDSIKSKIRLSNEIEKKVKVIKKGNDYWCCCPFHEEKTPSCKINNDLGSYYCFGCGAKGDIFTIYTELYNYSFPDAVKELARNVGIIIKDKDFKKSKDNENIFQILELTTDWFEENLKKSQQCQKYLKNRNLSYNTISDFRIGYSYNTKTSLYDFLKNKNFKDQDILKSNVVKKDSNNKIRDFFYKRLIFPICNEQNQVVGFGGRVLDNSKPKYINSPESFFFKKKDILYNLNQAKKNIRIKKNILICEGYMDVISLHDNKIKTAVAPLGTSLTESQLQLSWKFVDKPTIMFDGDNAGLRASYKSAIMALPFLSPNKYLQFIKLPKDLDPDSFINNHSFVNFVEILKKPLPIVNFIFDYLVSTVDLNNADSKISFDKYIEDITDTIKNNKIKYFYKNEFRKLFFDKLKTKTNNNLKINNTLEIGSLLNKQINSFLLSYVNHHKIRKELNNIFSKVNLFNDDQIEFIKYFEKSDQELVQIDKINNSDLPIKFRNILNEISQISIFKLFPYSKKDHNSKETLIEIEESIKNLNTRLSNLKKINKSLNEFEDNFSSISWEELRNISTTNNNEE